MPKDWSQCYKDEEARAMGLGNRNDACHRNCINRGFMGSDGGQWQDCGDWRFKIMCVTPDWKTDWNDDGCSGINRRRYARQVEAYNQNWEAAADFMMARMGDTVNGKRIVQRFREHKGAAGMWVVAIVEDLSCPRWGDWTAYECDKNTNNRVHGSRLWDIPNGTSWEDACNEAIKRHGRQGQVIDTRCVNKGGALGMWGEVRVADDGCKPLWMNTSNDCSGRKKKYFAKLDSKNWDWERACGDMANRTFDGENIKANCVKKIDGMYGEWIPNKIDYDGCDAIRADPSPNRVDKNWTDNKKCFATLTGPFGEMHENVVNNFTTDTIFTLEADNWISANRGKKTYLKAEDGSIRTDDNVGVTTDYLPKQYHFQFVKIECQTDKNILYGNHFQLKHVGTNQYSKCGGGTGLLHGTCSGTNDARTCVNNDWETFFIESAEGKIGRVCFGDLVYIRQTVDRKEAITPAGGGNVWSCTPGTTKNNILKIQGLNGSIYKDPSKEMSDYEANVRCQKLCKNNPADPACTFGMCSPFLAWIYTFLDKIKNYGTYAAGACITCVVLCILSQCYSSLRPFIS